MTETHGLRIHQLFEAQARRTPYRTALIVAERKTSYRDLNAMANAVARSLIAAGARRDEPVGVCLRRDELLIATLLGVLKAGAAYLPLDPDWPTARLQLLAKDAGLELLAVASDQLDAAGVIGPRPVAVDHLEPTVLDPEVPGDTSDAAYVVYTSGSTGEPKGVIVEHRTAVNLISWGMRTWSADELAGNLAAASVSFDFSVTELFPTLAAGGTVILAGSLLDLPALPARDQVTMVSGPPSGLRALLRRGLPAGVRTVNCGGEPLSSGLVELLFAQPGVQRVRNLYGPTECTTLSHAWDLKRGAAIDGDPPIGTAVADAQALILDPDGKPVADGEIGELWIAGAGVARGYFGRRELTAQRFVTDPQAAGGRRYRTGDLVRRADGVEHYIGRTDGQVKVRGFRVELGEVEKALAAAPGVAQAVVVAPADEDGVRSLVGYVVADAVTAITEPALREHLRRQLPAFMVPSRISVLDAFPLAPSGKVDRTALPPLSLPDPGVEYTVARDKTEERVAGVIARTLGLPRVGIFDGFYELGGDSLAAARVAVAVGAEFDVPVALADFLREPTAAALAARIAQAQRDGFPGPDLSPGPVRQSGRTRYPLVDAQWYMWMAPRMWPGANNTAGIYVSIDGPCDVRHVRTALDGIVRRHEVLRTVVEEEGETPVAVVRDAVPVPVEEADLRGLGAEERAAALDRIIADAAAYRFDLSAEVPLMRATFVRTGAATAVLALIIDHFAVDGFSVGPLMEELATGLDAAIAGRPDPTPEPPLQMGDVAVWEKQASPDSAALDRMREFWRGELDAAHSPNLPGVLRTKGPTNGARIHRSLTPAEGARIEALRADCGVTRFALFAAALGTVFTRRTGHDDTLLGVISARRDRAGVERVIGPMDGMLPLRLECGGRPGFRRLARRVADRAWLSLANQDIGIGPILELVDPDRPKGDPLLPVFLSMQPATVPVDLERGPVRVGLLGEIDAGSIFSDLAVLVNETTAGIRVEVAYDVERFTEAAAESFLDEVLGVLERAAADPDLPISQAVPETRSSAHRDSGGLG